MIEDPEKNQTDSRLRIQARNYATDYHVSGPDLIYFDRDHHRAKASVETDCFTSLWSLALVDISEPGELSIARKGRRVDLVGQVAIFIPPFSVIEWHIPAGNLRWGAYLSTHPIPQDIPDEPFFFLRTNRTRFSTITELFDFVRSADKKIAVGKEEESSAVAKRTKAYLNGHFSEPLGVSEIARNLRYSHAVMTRAFKRCYEISPICCRNKMRVFDSLRLMLFRDADVAATAKGVGFVDPGRFNKNFLREMNTTPSRFRFDRWQQGPD